MSWLGYVSVCLSGWRVVVVVVVVAVGAMNDECIRNDECIIKFFDIDGRVLQSFQRDKDGWFEISFKGIVRRCTAEQTLSHLLPPLAGASRAIVKVERISPKKSS
jgi:hypothetical protein